MIFSRFRLVRRFIGRVALSLIACAAPFFSMAVQADGPRDNAAGNVRRVPRLGIEVPVDHQRELQAGLLLLGADIAAVQEKDDASAKSLLPDVIIFHRAVSDALKHREFFSKGEIQAAKRLLAAGRQRASQLLKGEAPWTTQTGLVVRGYVSRIDRSVQPYGLVVPASYAPQSKVGSRLDIWFHGRGETLSEVKFLDQRMRQVGQYAPRGAFVLHPYGRYSNAFKFAGEVDVLEGLADVRKNYRIDADRISVRGFSMGGAACWQFAVHYADHWFAANPGAGFAETPEFLKFFQKETLHPTWYEQKLWRLYDCTDYAINLYHCPTVAYSGELDIQKQAADIMETALEKEGIQLTHIIGPQTKHAIHADAKVIIEKRLASLAERGRRRLPRKIRFTTYTLKYNRMHWLTIDAMGQHWERARVAADLRGGSRIDIKTENITQLTLATPAGYSPFDVATQPVIVIDGVRLEAPRAQSDRSWQCRLHKTQDGWRIGAASTNGLQKKHNLQGPIDDAFMDAFIFVRPTGKNANTRVSEWARSELAHAVEHWRRHFRGDAQVKDDTAVTAEDIAEANLVLFGDPTSNQVLAKIAAQLPIQWGEKEIVAGERRFDAAHHAVAMIFPNPLNPQRYVVLNSGFTFREYDYLNNARQVPKLPDWAVLDLRTPVSSLAPGKIVDADFFGEHWELRPPHQK